MLKRLLTLALILTPGISQASELSSQNQGVFVVYDRSVSYWETPESRVQQTSLADVGTALAKVPRVRLRVPIEHIGATLEKLPRFQNLRVLMIDGDWSKPINDLSWLEGFPQLDVLEVGAVAIPDFKPFLPLQCMSQLSLTIKGRCDFSLLPSFKNLRALCLENTERIDCAVLNEMPQLQSLSLSYSRIEPEQYAEIGKLVHLRKLYLRYVGLEDIAFLSELTNLSVLDLSWNQKLRVIWPVQKLTGLKRLGLSYTDVYSLKAISELRRLKSIDMEEISVTELPPIKSLRQVFLGNADKDLRRNNPNIDFVSQPTIVYKVSRLSIE